MSDSISWKTKTEEELKKIESTLESLGFSLEEDQPHISGERFLMTREKLVLMGTQKSNGSRVIIKVSNRPLGKEEIELEKKVRDALVNVAFANDRMLLPEISFFGEKNGYLVLTQKFIPQEKVFASFPIERQFFMSLLMFEEQEAFHATTFEHRNKIKNIFKLQTTKDYLQSFSEFKKTIENYTEDENWKTVVEECEKLLKDNEKLLDKHSNYLTHTDFVPGNSRISGRDIYMLDLSSMYFGNKYEGWARFINWATIHSPELDTLLNSYVLKNRGEEEHTTLRLMRIYKVGYLIDYYIKTLDRISGDLEILNKKRIELWLNVLKSIKDNSPLSYDFIDNYRKERNSLRSPEEMERQKEFNIPTA